MNKAIDKDMGLPLDAEWNYPEDYEQENGQYIHKCAGCSRAFHGHKRRHTCKLCRQAAAALVQKAENELANISDFMWEVMGMGGNEHAMLRRKDFTDGYIQGYLTANKRPSNPKKP